MTGHLKKISSELLFLFSIFVSFNLNAQIIKVACIGDSVTYGYGIDSVEKYSYPSQLQEMLGHGYEVKNFGYSGATMLKNGHKPYWKTEAFDSSLNYNPNIVIIHLGLNDQGNNNWPRHKGEFINDYLDMIGLYKELPSHPKIYICLMSPTFSGHHWFEEGMRENFNEIQQKIGEIAEMAKVSLINLHDPLYRFPELFPDNLHPVKEGATLLAKKIYGHISGDFGGLQLPLLYGENMVFQRDVPLRISGIANVPDTIE
ncbi:MAG: sialate O-acetylesterase, partial [Flavobacteriaceae bacterium]|nr:sialate O-acetylesterase [Flavobacteriaceae bacterium]